MLKQDELRELLNNMIVIVLLCITQIQGRTSFPQQTFHTRENSIHISEHCNIAVC